MNRERERELERERERRDYNNATMSFQLEEQLAVFIQAQSKRKDMQYGMEVTWENERDEQRERERES